MRLTLPDPFESALHQFQAENIETITTQLMDLIRIPSISKLPQYAPDCQRVLEAMQQILTAHGFSVEIVATPGLPVLLASLEVDPTAPWITVYNHMDVQPAEEPQWQTEPFEPILRDDRIYGRGSTDDKGPALSIVYAIAFLRQAGLPLPNIQIIYETEEESGSKHFGWFMDHCRERLKAPLAVVVSDTIFEGDHPALTFSLRGLLEADAELISGCQDQHSGMVGGVVENPLNILIHALSTCVTPDGTVCIPGVEAPALSPREQTELEKTAAVFNLEKLRQDSGQARFYTENSREILERIWCRPTFEVHGFEGVQTTPGMTKSALPYAVKAKLTLRLVAGQQPAAVLQALETHLQKTHPAITVQARGQLLGCRTALDSPLMQLAAEACQAGFGQPPLMVGSGGTIGALPHFQRVFPEAPLILIAQSLMSDAYHGPNENFRLSQLRAGLKTMAIYLWALAAGR